MNPAAQSHQKGAGTNRMDFPLRLVANLIRPAIEAWDRFWFQPNDPYSLAVVRLLAGGMLLYSHLIWGIDLNAFFGSDGWNNEGIIRSLQSDSYACSFWWYVPDQWLMPVHIVCCLVLLCFFLGLFTRVTSVLAWGIGISYAHRAMLANYGLDQIVCVLVMYLSIAPCGKYLSLDAWIQRWRKKKPSLVAPSIMANVSGRLMQIHLCVMYFFAGTSKLQGQSWWNGDAVWQALSNYEYQSIDLTFLAAFPLITHAATHLTILWEISFSALVWNRYLRPIVLLVGTSMHVGIGMFLGMWTFGLCMTFGYLSFLPNERLRSFIHSFCRIPAAAIPKVSPKPEGLQSLPSTAQLNVQHDAAVSEIQRQRDHHAKSLGSYQPPQEIDSLPGATPWLIAVVSNSDSFRINLFQYLRGYNQQVVLLTGMVQARALCQSAQQMVLVFDNPQTQEDRDFWIKEMNAVNPQSRFIFRERREGKAMLHPFVCTLPKRCHLRDVRRSIETLTGQSLFKTTSSDPPIKKSTESIGREAHCAQASATIAAETWTPSENSPVQNPSTQNAVEHEVPSRLSPGPPAPR